MSQKDDGDVGKMLSGLNDIEVLMLALSVLLEISVVKDGRYVKMLSAEMHERVKSGRYKDARNVRR